MSSNWTHVAGVVRIDGISIGGIMNFQELLGKECTHKDLEQMKDHPWDYLPTRSEGSLKAHIAINPEGGMTFYTVTLYGDLKDHDSADDVVEWFKGRMDKIKKDYPIRNAMITAINEQNGSASWAYED